MKIVLLGRDGQVGWELRRALAPLGQVVAPARAEGADLTKPRELCALVDRLAPDIVVNAAGYTAVDRAETEHDLAWQVNATAPAALAARLRERGAWLVHYSSDYVYDGTKDGAYREDDRPCPINAYGRSKAAGEQAILESRCRALVFRVGWVFGAHRDNFIKTILRLGAERETLRVVNDQFGAPTGAELIADVTAHALHAIAVPGGEGLAGVYNLVAAGETHWQDYARVILDEAAACGVPLKATSTTVEGIASSAYPTQARRPANSRLDTAKLRAAFRLHLPLWEDPVRRAVREIVG
jgi:dTDP-4-dehydrorhamnose reductase